MRYVINGYRAGFGCARRVRVRVRVDRPDGSYLHESEATVTNFETGAPLIYLDHMIQARAGDTVTVVSLYDPILMAEHIRWSVHRAA